MKLFIKLSLQWRVTLLTALVLITCSVASAAFSMINAQRNLIPVMNNLFSIVRFGESSIGITLDGIADDFILEDEIDSTTVSGVTNPQKAKLIFDRTSILFCIILTVAGTVIVYYVSGKALKPVRNLSEKVSKIDENNLSQRLPASTSNDEVSSLTRSFNHALDRLDEAFQRQHEFRTCEKRYGII